MSEGITREVPTQTVTVKRILFMDGSGLPAETETTANTVAELREELGLTGSVIVNDVVASADGSTPITQTDPMMRVSHVAGGKRGGATKKVAKKVTRKRNTNVRVHNIDSMESMKSGMRNLLGKLLDETEDEKGELNIKNAKVAIGLYDKSLKHMKQEIDVFKTNLSAARLKANQRKSLKASERLTLS